MIINFYSTIIQKDTEPQKIQFTSDAKKSKYKEFDVLEFKDPKDNIQNRIEYNDTQVTIFTGPSTLALKLKEDLEINYEMAGGVVTFISNMQELKTSDDKLEFKYTLSHNGKILGNYHIEIEIKNSH